MFGKITLNGFFTGETDAVGRRVGITEAFLSIALR